MNNTEVPYIWNPWNYFEPDLNNSGYAVLILNRPIDLPFHPSILLNIWNKAAVRATADGGTDRWLTWLKVNNYQGVASPPDLISGDMDSVAQETLRYFVRRSSKTQIIKTHDQNETDFTKALKEIKRFCALRDLKINSTIVVIDSSGRFDQILANINTLFKARNILPDVKVFQLSSNSLSWLLSKGSHRIVIPLNLRKNEEWCALIPIGAPCHASTTGLKWNLNKSLLEFGKLVSTSNTYDGDQIVQIQTDGLLVWSMGIESLF